MADAEGAYLWFDDCAVLQWNLQLMCAVAGRVVPLPVVILHPECALKAAGDTGRLGVPRWWARERGLVG